MQLVHVEENEVRVDLRWEDIALLVHVCKYAKRNDVLGQANDWGMGIGFLEATIAFLQAAGMASWAQTVDQESYTLERFLELVPITAAARRAEEARTVESNRERTVWERRWHERGGKVAELDGLAGPEYFIARDLPPLVLLPPYMPQREAAFRVACERPDALQPQTEEPPAA